MKTILTALAAALLTASAAHAAPAPAPAPASAEQRMAHISVVRMGTRGSPVVLIPGLSSPRAVWEPTARALAASHRVYLVQVNGFAGDAPGANLAPGLLPGVVDDLHAMIAAEKISGAAVIGHSMGGLVGMMLARAHGADVGRLLIVDTLPFFGVLMVPPGTPATVAAVTPMAEGMRAQMAGSYGKPAAAAAAEKIAGTLTATPAAKAQVARWIEASDPRVSGEAAYEDLTTDLRGQLDGLTMPVTVLVPWRPGQFTRDQLVGFYRAQYAGIPDARFVPIDNSAHFIMLDQPAAMQAAVAGFLAGK